MAKVAKGATDARDIRPTFPLAGVGGFLEVKWAGPSSDPEVQEGAKLEVEQWEKDHKLTDVQLPLSGGKGAMSTRRVCDSFVVTFIAAFDRAAARFGTAANTFAHQAFLDGRLEGSDGRDERFHFGLRLQCGDPTFVDASSPQPIARQSPEDPRDGRGIFYFCPRVLLISTQTLTNSMGKPPSGIVKAVVRVRGAAPLERWLGGKRLAIGSLGFDPNPKEGV